MPLLRPRVILAVYTRVLTARVRRSKLLFSSGFDMVIILWRLIGTQVKLVQRLMGHRKKVNGRALLAASSEGMVVGVAYYNGRNRVISAGDDEAIFVWDPNTGKPTCTMPFAHDGIPHKGDVCVC